MPADQVPLHHPAKPLAKSETPDWSNENEITRPETEDAIRLVKMKRRNTAGWIGFRNHRTSEPRQAFSFHPQSGRLNRTKHRS